MNNARMMRIGVATAVTSLGAVLLLIAATLAFDSDLSFGIALEVAALIALIFAVTELWSDLHGLRWRNVTARIVDTVPPVQRSVGEPLSPPRPQHHSIRIEYVVNGVTYRKQLRELVEPGTPVTVGRYPIDGELTIYYDPQAPYRSRFTHPPCYVGFGYLTFGLLLLGAAAIGIVLI
jgi:hypothetical protein